MPSIQKEDVAFPGPCLHRVPAQDSDMSVHPEAMPSSKPSLELTYVLSIYPVLWYYTMNGIEPFLFLYTYIKNHICVHKYIYI